MHLKWSNITTPSRTILIFIVCHQTSINKHKSNGVIEIGNRFSIYKCNFPVISPRPKGFFFQCNGFFYLENRLCSHRYAPTPFIRQYNNIILRLYYFYCISLRRQVVYVFKPYKRQNSVSAVVTRLQAYQIQSVIYSILRLKNVNFQNFHSLTSLGV